MNNEERLKEALIRLVDKIEMMAEPLNVVTVVAYNHGTVYEGPTWEAELEEAKKLLEELG